MSEWKNRTTRLVRNGVKVRHVVSAPHRKQVAYVFHGTRK